MEVKVDMGTFDAYVECRACRVQSNVYEGNTDLGCSRLILN